MYVEELGAGEAPTLVLLHAMGCAHDMWRPQLARLSGLFRVVAPDLPGHGRSPGPFSVETAVDALGELTAGGRPVHLCGVSLGARVALRFAAEHPDAVASLILSGCGVRAPRRPTAERRAAERPAMRALPRRLFARREPGAEKTATLRSGDALAGPDLSDSLEKIKAPTLLLCGADDTRHLADAHELHAGIAGAELRVIPGAGHIVPTERPELFTRTLLEWSLEHA